MGTAVYALILAPIIPRKGIVMLDAAHDILEACGFAGLSNGRNLNRFNPSLFGT
jgi:hypothetical protein